MSGQGFPTGQSNQAGGFWQAMMQQGVGRGAGRGRGSPMQNEANQATGGFWQAMMQQGVGRGAGRGRAAPMQSTTQPNNTYTNQSENGPFAQMMQGFAQHALRSRMTEHQNQLNKPSEPQHFDVSFSQEQLCFFRDNGYIKLPNVVDKKLISRALLAINARLSKGMTEEEAAKGNVVRGGLGYWPDLSHTDVILDLVKKSALKRYVELLVGQVYPLLAGQIALRFPGKGCITKEQLPLATQRAIQTAEALGIDVIQNQLDPSNPNGHLEAHPFSKLSSYFVPRKWKEFWHIDGVRNSRFFDLPEGYVMQFTLLVGVLLKDLPEEFSGNLAVFPGSHLAIQDFVNQHGVDPASLLQVSSSDTAESVQVNLPNPPVQIRGNAGDVVLCHWQLAHTVAPNASPDIRYCVYFRFHSHQRTHGIFRPEAMRNCWLEFEGIQALNQ